MVPEPLEQQALVFQVLSGSGRVDHNFIEMYDEVGQATGDGLHEALEAQPILGVWQSTGTDLAQGE